MGYSPQGHSRTQLSSGSAGRHNLGALEPGGGVPGQLLPLPFPQGWALRAHSSWPAPHRGLSEAD